MKKRKDHLLQGQTRNDVKTKIIVKFYASIREKMDLNEITLSFSKNPSFHQVMKRIKDSTGLQPFDLLNSSKKNVNIMISINNRLVHSDDLPNLRLEHKDVIDIMPLPSGG